MLVLLDVVGTTFTLERPRQQLRAAGCPDGTLEQWFARLLHCAATLALTGAHAPFPEVARAALAHVLTSRDLPQEALEPALQALTELDPWPDAAEAVARLQADGHTVAALTNSPEASTRALLGRAGLPVEHVVSVDEVRAFKPAAAPYARAVEHFPGLTPVLVAAHAWDVLGAASAGLRSVWVSRLEQVWPFPGNGPPDMVSADLAGVPALL